jgi:hypothetical protein
MGCPGCLALFQIPAWLLHSAPSLPPRGLCGPSTRSLFQPTLPKKTPLARGVGRLLVCGGVSFSLLFGGRGIRRAGRLWPDPRFFRLSLDLVFLPRRLPLMAIRKATLVPAGLEGAVSACTDPRGLSKRDAMHIVDTPDGPTRHRGALFERVMSVF